MQPEELMLPRYKVIADYPDSEFEVGEILLQCKDGIRIVSLSRNMFMDFFKVHKYPHLFKPLSCWEDRKPEEMPEYVKEKDSLYKIGEVIKVKEWDMEDEETDVPCFMDEKDNHFTWVRGFEPATLEEYNAYINKQ